jgi:SET domain-containing protein
MEGCVGSGLFETHCCINHSCVPNTVMKIDVDTVEAEVVIRALTDINKDEEICITYLHEDNMDKQKRQNFLSTNYCFTCTCPKCLHEA